MDLGLKGKRALVFGGSRGMGRAIATQFAREGVHVTIAARNPETLARTAAEIEAATGMKVTHVSADITTEEGRKAALGAVLGSEGGVDAGTGTGTGTGAGAGGGAVASDHGPDILINNADGPHPTGFQELTRDDWIGAFDSMMLGPIMMMRAVVDGMIARRFGRIVNISSRSVRTPQNEMPLSNGARSALVGFVAGLSRQTVQHNVTINNLLPGVFDSDAQINHIRGMLATSNKSFEQLWEERGKSNPAGRYGRTEEIGALCAFLCSQHAGFITGQNLLIDGGAYPGTL